MIQIFQKANDELKQVYNYHPGTWINISAPATSEIEEVCHELKVPLSLLSDPLDIDERARIEIEDDYLLILIRVPIYDEEAEVPYRTIPLGIIYSRDHIITIASRRLDVLHDFVQNKVKNFNFDNRERFVFQIFFRVAVTFLNFLKEINNRANAIETKLHRAVNNKQLISLLLLEKGLVYFTTAIKADEIMINRLSTVRQFKVSGDDSELFDDVIIEYRQALEMANIYSNILGGMMSAFASVISNNLSSNMKLLTSLTVMLMIPTLISSFYGMNIDLPFQRHPHAFTIVVVTATALVIIALLAMIKRRLF